MPARPRLGPAALVADEMMMVVARRIGRLVARLAVDQVDLLHPAPLDEQVEHAVDARDPHRPPVPLERVEDLPRRRAAALAAEGLDDGPPRAAGPVALAAQRVERL